MPAAVSPTSRPSRRLTASTKLALGVFGVLGIFGLSATGCRFMPSGAHWIEGHGEGRLVHLAGSPAGVLGIGEDTHLWAYPVEWSRPWVQRDAAQELRTIASSPVALYAIVKSGEVVRVVDGRWTTFAGSIGWGATSLGASEDDRLFIVIGGRIRRVEGVDLKEAPCDGVSAAVVSGVRGDEIYVVDAAGALHHGTPTSCPIVPTPTPVRDVAARNGRLIVVATDGRVWRRRGDEAWRLLPAVNKYRPFRGPFEVKAAQVALTDYSTWLLDREGSVFVLSDES